MMNGQGQGLYPNQGIGMMSQAVDQLVDEAKAETAFKRQQSQWEKQEQIRQQERGETIEREGQQKKTGLLLDLIKEQIGITKDVGQKGELMKEARDVIGGEMDVSPELFETKEQTIPTPKIFMQVFGDAGMPERVTESQLETLSNIVGGVQELEKMEKDIELTGKKTETEESRKKLVDVQALWTSKRPYTGRGTTESNMKAKIIQKGMTDGFDTLSDDEKLLIGIDSIEGIQTTLEILQDELIDTLTGELKENADPDMIERYNFLIEALAKKQAERTMGADALSQIGGEGGGGGRSPGRRSIWDNTISGIIK